MHTGMKVVAAGVLACPVSAWADSAQIQAQKDNTLYESPTGSLSNGIGPGMFCGRAGGGLIRRALVKFDVAASIPAGSTINSVTLRLVVSQSISPALPCSVHRALADWGEGQSASLAFGGGMGAPAEPGDATWLHTFYSAQLWATPGGDFAAAPSATIQVGVPEVYTWGSTPEMVADVQGWLDTPASNFGWIVVGDETTPATAKRFDTKDHLTEPNRPLLTVDFTPPPCYPDCNGVGGLTIADFGCFQTKFVAGDPYADCNGVGGLTIADFGCFQTKFVAGCP